MCFCSKKSKKNKYFNKSEEDLSPNNFSTPKNERKYSLESKLQQTNLSRRSTKQNTPEKDLICQYQIHGFDNDKQYKIYKKFLLKNNILEDNFFILEDYKDQKLELVNSEFQCLIQNVKDDLSQQDFIIEYDEKMDNDKQFIDELIKDLKILSSKIDKIEQEMQNIIKEIIFENEMEKDNENLNNLKDQYQEIYQEWYEQNEIYKKIFVKEDKNEQQIKKHKRNYILYSSY